MGLRLLASSLDRASSPEERRLFIHHLAETDRHIFDFLAEEVFNRQEAEVRVFLGESDPARAVGHYLALVLFALGWLPAASVSRRFALSH